MANLQFQQHTNVINVVYSFTNVNNVGASDIRSKNLMKEIQVIRRRVTSDSKFDEGNPGNPGASDIGGVRGQPYVWITCYLRSILLN